MPVVVIQEWAEGGDNTANYDAINEKMGTRENPPEGLVIHTSGVTEGGGFRIVDVWDSREHFERFFADRLGPAVQAVVSADATPPRTEVYETYSVISG